MRQIYNIVRNAVRPRRGLTMLKKVGRRIQERGALRGRGDPKQWCRAEARAIRDWMIEVDPRLAAEAANFYASQSAYGARKVREVSFDLGGGGAHDLLYFLTRLLQPKVVVETGVAAGFSSRAVLSALRLNGCGRLYSSDFPLFRIEEPEKYIGYIVEPELRDGWRMLTDGDGANLPKIVGEVSTIDLFHYDSDKSVAGRESGLSAVSAKLTPASVIIFDDIQNNFHFHDLVKERNAPYLVFEFEGKWLGMTGGPRRLYG